MYRTAVTICTAQWSLYVPHSGHYMYRTVVTICTASLTFNNPTFCPHSVFMCFVWIWEQTTIISLYSINWLVFSGVRKIAKTDYYLCRVPLSVRPPPVDGVALNLIFDYFFEKYIQKVTVPVQSNKNSGTSRADRQYNFDTARSFSSVPQLSHKALYREQKHTLCSAVFSFYRAVYKIMWRNVMELDRPQMAIWRMRIASWVPKAINAHSEYVVLTAFHCNDVCTNEPQCYVTLALPVLL
jgi:hypothetical protein